jgi:hypothetical protein
LISKSKRRPSRSFMLGKTSSLHALMPFSVSEGSALRPLSIAWRRETVRVA